MATITMFSDGCKRSDNPEQLDTVALTKHWEKPIPNQIVPQGLLTIRAEECRLCHSEIYKEWKKSMAVVSCG